MLTLHEIKQSLMQKGNPSKEKKQVDTLCAVMEVVGGYEQLQNLPLPALTEIIESLERREEEMKKKGPK